MAKPNEEIAAWRQNVRDNQIGGETDGISTEVAEDLGFRPPQIALRVGSGAMLATSSEAGRTRRSKLRHSMTPAAIYSRERRARRRREEGEREQTEKGPFDMEFGGK